MRVAVCGIGRAGKVMMHYLLENENTELVLGINRDSSATVGRDIGDVMGIPVQNVPVVGMKDLRRYIQEKRVEGLIDFSHKSLSLELLQTLEDFRELSLVICTTNYTDSENAKLQLLLSHFVGGVVYADTLSLGINLLRRFAAMEAKLLSGFQFDIVEKHIAAKPKPTATAKRIAEAIGRDTPIHSMRLGGYVGVHELTAADAYERLTITHESFTREAFARGAMIAMCFLKGRQGVYSMDDVLRWMENSAHG